MATSYLFLGLGVLVVAMFVALVMRRVEQDQSWDSPEAETSLEDAYAALSWWTGKQVQGRSVRVRVDHELCMGASSCVTIAPKVFHLDWAKRQSVSDPAPLEVLNQKGSSPGVIFLAAQSCPYRAIALEDADTQERLFP